MKISNYGQRPAGINPYERELTKTKSARKTETERKADDKLEISEEALRLQKQYMEPARQEKIKELKAQYDRGTYTIDYTEVARKMIEAFNKKQQ